jgi:hypothetical protein
MGEQNAGGDNNAAEEKKSGADGQQGAGDGAAGTDDKGEKKADDKGDGGEAADDGEAPKVRDKKDFIIQRLKEKNDRLAAGKNKDKKDDGANEDEDEISEDDERMVNKVITKNFGDVLTRSEEQQDKGELNEFIGANPEFKNYEAKIWRFWQDPSRRHLPVSTIAYEVAGKDLLKIGAARGKAADDKAKENSNAGGSGGSAQGKKPVAEMSVQEFLEYKEEVKRRRAD